MTITLKLTTAAGTNASAIGDAYSAYDGVSWRNSVDSCDADGNGRVLLPPLLRDYAHLDKHVVMIGQGNKFEIWDEPCWQTRRQQWLDEESAGDSLPDEMKTFFL